MDLKIDIDFDSGSLDVERTRVEGNHVTLAGLENHNRGYWKWLHFRMRGVRGRDLTFEIGDNFEPGSDRLDHHRMVYSYDGQQWEFFPGGERVEEQQRYYFSLGDPFQQDTVFVAYGIPYPYERVVHFVESIRPSPFVRPTASSDEHLVLGLTPGGRDEIGREIPRHNLYGFRISDDAADGARQRIVVMGGVHPNEPLANHAIEGLIDYLLQEDDPEARALRRAAEFFVYPMVNPDGRVAGYNRSTVQHVDRDANRFWREDLYEDMDDIRQVAEAMKVDAGSEVDYFVDFHCWTNTIHHFGILARSEGFHRDPFWLALRELEPELEEMDSGWENWSTETFGVKRLGARFAMTLETMFIPDENVDRFKRLGRNVGRAFARAILPSGQAPDEPQ